MPWRARQWWRAAARAFDAAGQALLDRGQQLLQCDRLLKEIERADLGRLDRRVDGGVADIMMTGIVSCPCADHSLSRVTPSVSGIQISSSTRSGVPAARYSRACSAFSASSTTWPSSLRISESSSRIPISSSTTRIVAILPLLTPPQRSGTGRHC
ncbi:hypothetical protein AU476_35540 [Cupriavidus sp. UYMSc13B]|nr:hypothetical protein AU476_35540 [Cupriavidus sp. UYMSc13B]